MNFLAVDLNAFGSGFRCLNIYKLKSAQIR